MESLTTENSHSPSVDVGESQDAKSCDSAENFQKFMFELFEKNGVINDLRAYLRGHIVGVLRSVQTGEPPTCQKHFTQRLELPFQALNMLIAEYLLRLEFSYSLSVFVSEIPLANMVFAFAKSLMMNSSSDATLRFKDEDVWSILNYLGVKCDSEHASSVVKMYKRDKQTPLLVCIMKTMALCKELPQDGQADSANESISSGKSSESIAEKLHPAPSIEINKCKHYAFCDNCQSKVLRIKDKYKKKKKILTQNIKETSIKKVESLLRNIDVIEKSLIDEMFQQLKSVYESEMEMMKNNEEKRVRRSVEAYAAQLQEKRDEMEQKFKAREAELAKSVQAKKRFLWGLAKDLRDQHQSLARAMHDVRDEANRLSAKEESLKSQLAKAEEILRQRGEDMRQQISSELTSLEEHLDCMKKERDSINKERSELEHMRQLCNGTNKTTNILTQNEDLYSNYDLIKSEFLILQKYLETAKVGPKCVIERSTITELADVTSKIDVVLNNGQDVERNNSDLKAKRVVNDLKKHKNVNFSQSNLDEIYRERSRSSRSHSSVSSEAGDALSDAGSLHRLRDENERLRTFARQQREHIDELSSQQARLHAELAARALPPAPRAPPPAPRAPPPAARAPPLAPYAPAPAPRARPAPPEPARNMQRLNSSASTNNLCHGWRKGAGEELSLFADARPTIVVPGDTVPFIGRVDRQPDTRYISQSVRRRASPELTALSPVGRLHERPSSAGPSVETPGRDIVADDRSPDEQHSQTRENVKQRPKTGNEKSKSRENDETTLREAKERLRSMAGGGARSQSPTSVIRAARLRLRRLEVEAAAVERSYRDFRARARTLRPARTDNNNVKSPTPDEINAIQSTSHSDRPKPNSDFSKYIQEYRTKCDLSETIYKNKNTTSAKVKPVPAALSSVEPAKICNQNYLETPIAEFRKYYQSEKRKDAVTVEFVDNTDAARTPTFINVAAFDHKNNQAKKRDDARNDNSPKSKIPIPMGKFESTKSSHNREYIEIVDTTEPPDIPNESASNEKDDPNSEKQDKSRDSPNSGKVEDKTSTVKSRENSGADDTPRSLTRADLEKYEISKSQSPKIPSTSDHLPGKHCPKSPKAKNSKDELQARLDTSRKSKHSKELEILKKNISKIYNVSEKTIEENLYKDKTAYEISESNRRAVDETIMEVTRDLTDDFGKGDERNLLRIELDSVSEVNDVKIADSQTQDLLLVVESSVEGPLSDTDLKRDVANTQMTILVSPKRSPTKVLEAERSKSDSRNFDSDEKSIQICGKDFHAIYQNDPSESNSVHIQSDVPKIDEHNSDLEANEDPDYPDDFSADVDNFNNPHYDTDVDNLSPISMPKTSETETWES